jgi:hypothetical protein
VTLVVVSEVELARGLTLLVATDSMLSAGYRWPRGPKLFTLGAHCVMAFEGDTQIAYPLLTNARNFISFSDNLSGPDAEPAAIFERVQLDVSEAYHHLVQSSYFNPAGTTCSLILAGWSWRLRVPVVWTLQPPVVNAPLGTLWPRTDVVVGALWQQHHCFFAGNGDQNPVTLAWNDVTNCPAPRLPAYAAFWARINDTNETAVGGEPQVALIGPRMREIIGIRDNHGRRYLLGHLVPSGARGVDFYDEALATLQ